MPKQQQQRQKSMRRQQQQQQLQRRQQQWQQQRLLTLLSLSLSPSQSFLRPNRKLQQSLLLLLTLSALFTAVGAFRERKRERTLQQPACLSFHASRTSTSFVRSLGLSLLSELKARVRKRRLSFFLLQCSLSWGFSFATHFTKTPIDKRSSVHWGKFLSGYPKLAQNL